MSEVLGKAIGASRLVKALLEAGAKPMVPAPNAKHLPPLAIHLATKAEDAESIRLLSRSKADVNVVDPQSGRSPLHISTSKRSLPVVLALLSARCNVNFPDPLEGEGHLPAAGYAQRRAYPRLALHTAAGLFLWVPFGLFIS